LSSGFPVFFYETSGPSSWILDGNGFGYRTDDPSTACLFVAGVDLEAEVDLANRLPYWRGDGRNHLLVSILLISFSAEQFPQKIYP
jgi:hypothetical protein